MSGRILTVRAPVAGACWVVPVLMFGASVSALADPSCDKLIDATTPKPDLPYRVSQTIMIQGKAEVSEAVFIDRVLYVQTAGKWRSLPMPDVKQTIQVAKDSTSQCVAGGTELVGTTPTRVWTSRVKTPFSEKAVQWKTWIGVADGRVYRQQTQDYEQRIFYDNVMAPVVEPTATRRKRP